MHVLALLVTAGAVAAQDFTIPSSWRKPNVTQSREDRIAIAQRAINYTNGFYDTRMGRYNFPGNATSDGTFIDHDDAIESARHGASSLRYTAMHDLIAGTTVYQSFVTSALKNAVAATPARQDVTGPPTGTLFGIGIAHDMKDRENLMTETLNQIGLAAVYAYRAYNDSSMLGVAQTVQQVVQNTSQFEADPTTYPGSQAAIQKCANTGLAGVILPYLYGNAPNTAHLIQNGWVQSSDWAGFLALSAYVASASTGTSASEDAVTTYGYLASSGLSIVDADTSFIHSVLVYNATAGNKEDVNSPIYPNAAHNFTNCGAVDAGSPSAGVYVEALGAHANLTSSPTIQQQQLRSLLTATAHGLSTDGILSNEHPPYLIGRGGHLAGLMDTLLRTTNETVRTYVQAYANVQFNALQDNALHSDGVSYGSLWTPRDGDYGDDFDVYYQLEAIPALNLAIGRVPSPTTTPTSTATGTGTGTASPSSSSNNHTGAIVGAIVGGVLGALAMLAAVFVFLCCRRRRRRREQEEAPIPESPSRFVPEPYALQLEQTDTSRRGLLLDSGGAPLSKRSLAATASSTQVHSKGLGLDTGSETIALTEMASDGERDREESVTDRETREAEDAEAHDAFIERIPTRYLARILHERVTGAAPGDGDDFEWRLGGADGVTSPPSYRSGSVHQG